MRRRNFILKSFSFLPLGVVILQKKMFKKDIEDLDQLRRLSDKEIDQSSELTIRMNQFLQRHPASSPVWKYL